MQTYSRELSGIQEELRLAYNESVGLTAFSDVKPSESRNAVSIILDRLMAHIEIAALGARLLAEKFRPASAGQSAGAVRFPTANLNGAVEVTEFGWIHIALNTLLPSSRVKAAPYLGDTIIRLLEDYRARRGALPLFEKAMLVIDEHSDIESRNIYDQDNKGWKAIPNALKGMVIADDDQFSLDIALLSTKSDDPACHIYVLDAAQAHDFFALRSGEYGRFF